MLSVLRVRKAKISTQGVIVKECIYQETAQNVMDQAPVSLALMRKLH